MTMLPPRGVIYLDGPNAAGKTTLASAIKKQYPNTKVIHCKYRFKDAMWTYHLAALRRALRFAETGLAVVDRNWISEEIYGHCYRAGTPIPHQGRVVQKLLLKHGVVTILCLLPDDHAVAQVEKHRQRYHSPQFITDPGQVARRYWATFFGEERTDRASYVEDIMALGGLATRKDCGHYMFHTDGCDLPQATDNIMQVLNWTRGTQYPPALKFEQRNIAGHLATAKYLIVGDKVNHPDYKRCWPFMTYKNSALFITLAMHRLNCREEEFMWTNADCPEFHVTDILKLKPKLHVIALGTAASAILTSHGVKHSVITHPSHGRRFSTLPNWTGTLAGAIGGLYSTS